MKIIIPMAGSSSAFLEEGLGIKPLVRVAEKPVIERVCYMFPRDSEFLFLCKQEDLERTILEKVLKRIAPRGRIIPVTAPTRDVVETIQLADIPDSEEIIIHHADSFAVWDFTSFLEKARKHDGALTVFSGFNPAGYVHALYGLIKPENGLVKEIVEKQPFAATAENGYTAAGSYYFSSWGMFKKYARQMREKGNAVDGKFFDSLVYNEMISDGKKVAYHAVDNFISWGEPAGVNEYNFWSEYFASLVNSTESKKTYDMINLIPAAGKGKRFSDAGYTTPKPLINVLGKTMIAKSAEALPKANKYIFVILKEQSDSYNLDKVLKESIPGCEVVVIDNMTDGMARTCLMAEHLLDKEKPLIISSCDYSFVYNDAKFEKTIREQDPDVMIFTFRHYPDARLAPKAYAYVVVENGVIKRVSEKVPISDQPHKDHIVQGSFWFKDAGMFLWAAKEMIRKGITVNGEYYVATAINELIETGKKVVPFDLDKYICWGTPLDLKTFEYWQDHFSNDPENPYRKETLYA